MAIRIQTVNYINICTTFLTNADVILCHDLLDDFSLFILALDAFNLLAFSNTFKSLFLFHLVRYIYVKFNNFTSLIGSCF